MSSLPMLHITACRARVANLKLHWRRERIKIERMLDSLGDRCERGNQTRKEAAKG